METHPEMVPPDRRTDPKRRAEARVFDEIQRSRLPGFAHYEWQRDPRSPQLDFAVWLPEVGRFGLQVKGGHYSLQRGKWYLRTGSGSEEKDSPLQKTWDATMSIHVVQFTSADHTGAPPNPKTNPLHSKAAGPTGTRPQNPPVRPTTRLSGLQNAPPH